MKISSRLLVPRTSAPSVRYSSPSLAIWSSPIWWIGAADRSVVVYHDRSPIGLLAILQIGQTGLVVRAAGGDDVIGDGVSPHLQGRGTHCDQRLLDLGTPGGFARPSLSRYRNIPADARPLAARAASTCAADFSAVLRMGNHSASNTLAKACRGVFERSSEAAQLGDHRLSVGGLQEGVS